MHHVILHTGLYLRCGCFIPGSDVANNLIDPYYLCTTRYDDSVLVTDFAEPNIKMISLIGDDNSQMSGEYGTVCNQQGLLQPYGCCQDQFGITFIADNRNDKVNFELGHFIKFVTLLSLISSSSSLLLFLAYAYSQQ